MVYQYNPDCCCGGAGGGPDCPECGGSVPGCFELVVAGIAKGTGNCANCDDYNGTFILPFSTVPGAQCDWVFIGPSHCGGSTTGVYSLTYNATDDAWTCGIAIRRPGAVMIARYRLSGALFDCQAANTLAFHSFVNDPISCSIFPASVVVQPVACP